MADRWERDMERTNTTEESRLATELESGDETVAVGIGDTDTHAAVGQTTEVRNGAVGIVRADQASVNRAVAGLVLAGGDVSLSQAGARTVVGAGDLDLRQGGAGAILSGGDTSVTQGGAGALVSLGEVEIEQGGAGLVLATEVEVEQGGFVAIAVAPRVDVQEGGRVLVRVGPREALGVVAALAAVTLIGTLRRRGRSQEG